jgi:hypothetical protein
MQGTEVVICFHLNPGFLGPAGRLVSVEATMITISPHDDNTKAGMRTGPYNCSYSGWTGDDVYLWPKLLSDGLMLEGAEAI